MEGVEHRLRRVTEIRFQFRTGRNEPRPVNSGLENTEAVVVTEGEA